MLHVPFGAISQSELPWCHFPAAQVTWRLWLRWLAQKNLYVKLSGHEQRWQNSNRVFLGCPAPAEQLPLRRMGMLTHSFLLQLSERPQAVMALQNSSVLLHKAFTCMCVCVCTNSDLTHKHNIHTSVKLPVNGVVGGYWLGTTSLRVERREWNVEEEARK